jgi:hypothetical protein
VSADAAVDPTDARKFSTGTRLISPPGAGGTERHLANPALPLSVERAPTGDLGLDDPPPFVPPPLAVLGKRAWWRWASRGPGCSGRWKRFGFEDA